MQTEALQSSTLRNHLSAALAKREPHLDPAKIPSLVEPLLSEAAVWAKGMALKDIGVRLDRSSPQEVRATLCDHTVDGCDCGEH